MITCPNKNLKEWKDLVSQVGESRAYLLWDISEGDVSKLDTATPNVNFSTKVVNSIINNLSKVNSWFKQLKDTDAFWSKVQKDLGIPKEQVELLKNSEGNTIEDKLLNFSANYSYTVEINVAKESLTAREEGAGVAAYKENGKYYVSDPSMGISNEITKQEYDNWIKRSQTLDKPTKHYSNLTVPGGTNYTENEIATPAITPSIKGHAQFATDNGIGWFRSDEVIATEERDKRIKSSWEGIIMDEDGNLISDNRTGKIYEAKKTRRILEVQSDLFQKWRNNFEFEGNKYTAKKDDKNVWRYYKNGSEINSNEYTKIWDRFLETYLDNADAFTKLLQKDNNWVTFFIKSIIQDSTKKGYEKVLFPSGNTASKVEGHTTLEEFKKQKEDRIKGLKKNIEILKSLNKDDYRDDFEYITPNFIRKDGKDSLGLSLQAETFEEAVNNYIDSYEFEINQLKQELERVEIEGFGALKPIFNFYENTVTNILKKQGFSPKVIKDEYGNTWNEVDLSSPNTINSVSTILFSKNPLNKLAKDLGIYKKEVSGQQRIDIKKNVESYNKKNGRSLFVEFKQLGQSNTFTWNIIDAANGQTKLFSSQDSFIGEDIETDMFPVDDTTSNKQVQDTILEKGTEVEKELVNILKEFSDETTPVEFTDDIEELGSFEYVSGKPGTIKINNKASNKTRVYIHELAHETTARVLEEYLKGDKSKLNKEQISAIQNLIKLYKQLKDNNSIGEYGFKTIYEFISEVYSNKTFQDKLNNIKYENSNVFSKILDLLAKLLGLNKDSALSEALNESFKLMQNTDYKKSYGTDNTLNLEKDKAKKEQKKSAFEKQYVYFTRRISRLNRELKEAAEGTKKYNQIKDELDLLEEQLAEANEEQSLAMYTNLGEHMLSRAEAFVKMLETDKASVSKDNLLFTINTLATFKDFPGLETEANSLFRRVYPFLSQHTLEIINKYKTEDEEITQSMIDGQDKDISTFTKSVGALSDLANYIGRTIGSLIKAAQNRASSLNKQLVKTVQTEVDKLDAYAKSNGLKLEDVYEMLIDETKDDIQLVSPYINGKENPKWKVLERPENKAVKDFYNFYRTVLGKAEMNLPYKVGKNHIPNIAKTDIKYRLNNLLKSEEIMLDSFRTNEDLHADMVPDMFRAKLDKTKKSRDLGASILEFTAYSNMHNELSKALPEVRLLQEQSLYQQMGNGVVVQREYIKSTDPNTRISAKDSNLYKMIDIVIDMQLKGKMSKDIFKPIKTKEIKDEDGNVIGYKQVKIDDALDLGLKYNSLLRIGLSPITAIANVTFGDVSNILESVGGRFFGFKELRQATNIFRKQINYFSDERTSELYKWLDKLNPLQELDDYNISDQVRLNKMTPEKAQEYMYAMQKKGELFLQSRTMLAVLIREKYMTPDGKTTTKGKELLENESGLQKLSDKVQRLNQMIHGRYSQREAATAQQSVIYRMMVQFRKWIPSAIEARLGEKQYDNRLGIVIEGRYKTFWNLVTNLNQSIERLKSGTLTELEIYNMKKNLMEITILAASMLGYAWLHGGDDEESKKRRKNPYVKTLLTLTDRVAGDLGFFYNPANFTNLAKNAMPIAKTADDLRKVILNIPYAFYVGEWEIKKGSLKGSNKFYSSAKKVMIGFKPYQDIQKLLNDNPLDEFN